MCGIAGIFNYAELDRPIDEGLLVRMTRALEHRGPDDEGFYIQGPVGLGHRRLTIVDLTPTGHQPLPNTDHSRWITYNGEFYNHQEFRRQLLAAGHTFRGTSDTETLLHLIEARGPDCLKDVAGIFAFAYWDQPGQELTLARDPLGVKPLYYYDDGRRILFASEMKALLQCPEIPRELDTEAVNQYLHFHTTLFDRTFLKHIKQLRAGEYLRVSRTRSTNCLYWKVDDFRPRTGTPEEQVEELEEMLQSIVGDQLMSDVPVGSFFSGGIDSSAVAAMAARLGKPPICFGVHFTDQGVVDERPYQEAAAKALGLKLQLITCDGSSFPDDLMKLIYFQDQPVIGTAMFPMYLVSKLASENVKVCLGGQAADEVFGGYARYGLTHPWQVARSWFARPGKQAGDPNGPAPASKVGGNLWLQVADRRNLRRLADNVSNIGDWQRRYFEHFAKIREADWQGIFAPEIASRSRCYETFQQTVNASAAEDPADKAMHWDMQTYLTGLFHQDDRMSMACSLESRVPLADPRLVRFSFQTRFDLKFRSGATKWLLRQAVARELPEFVLNRRKIGFDTPAERWMRGQHAGFVRDLLLSSEARNRGLWNARGLEKWLDQSGHPQWFDVVWKAVCIESWAKTFLGANSVRHVSEDRAPVVRLRETATIRNSVQEVRELGLAGSMSRAAWELKLRLRPRRENVRPAQITISVDDGQISTNGGAPNSSNGKPALDVEKQAADLKKALPFIDPQEVISSLRGHIPDKNIARLEQVALDSLHGRIVYFGRWTAAMGRPIDWHLNPTNGKRWRASAHWSQAVADTRNVGDVKLTWEVARFPQAYFMARAAAFSAELQSPLAEGLASQIKDFMIRNPFGRGIHWNSGQELAIRLMAWTFSLNLFLRLGQTVPECVAGVLNAAYEYGTHIERNLHYAKTVANNHLISEALGLLLAGNLVQNLPEAERWRVTATTILDREARRQFHSDGGYIMQSHNYHRSVMQMYLWASVLTRGRSGEVPASWHEAMMSSLDYFYEQQNPVDGRLPNYGANDGALPSVLSTCNFSDFRPVLQALSVATRGERIFEPGPWDEETAWLLGPDALKVPIRKQVRRSVSFPETGLQLMRGNSDSFAVLRCGSVRARYSQIDMLHLDVWWRGLNMLLDGGSYLYNGPEEWHQHFARTESHNTVQVDNLDQMLHYRRFKNLYWTKARLITFADNSRYVLCAGEHYGFRRSIANCIHRRSVMFLKDDLWVVYDQVFGDGVHKVRLHWLCADFPFEYQKSDARLTLDTPYGQFSILTVDATGQPVEGDVARGQENPPRGWHSRYYGEKTPTPSLAVERTATLPTAFITILGSGDPRVVIENEALALKTSRHAWQIGFGSDGLSLISFG